MVYVTGDTHGDIKDPRWDWFDSHLNADDILIITGDFGFDWDGELVNQWNHYDHKYTVLFCDGNHENYDILNSLSIVEGFGDVVGKFNENTFRLLTGHMYQIEEKSFFVFGGAASIDKDWRVISEERSKSPRTLWWPEEVPSEEAFELAKQTLSEHGWKFDYLITHTCNPELKGPILHTYKMDFYDPTESMIQSLEWHIKENGGCYKKSFFGHFHKNVHFGTYHALYGDVVNLTEGVYYKGFDDYSYETWEKIPLEEGK